MYEEILNYILLMPENIVTTIVTESYSFTDFRKHVKKYFQSHNTQLRGRYYTPDLIAQFIVKIILESLEIAPDAKILDLCSGTGSFSRAICDFLLLKFTLDYPEKSRLEIKHHIIKHNLRAIDIDPIATYILRFGLVLWFLLEHPSSIQITQFIKDLNGAIRIGNILSDQNQFGLKFDAIISNPPYVSEKSNKKFLDQMVISKNSRYQKARLDYSLHFLAYALSNINNSGKLGFLIPSYFLDVKSASSIREFLYTHTSDLNFYDLKDQKVFSKAPGFHSCILTTKLDSSINLQQKMAHYYINLSQKKQLFPYTEAFHPDFDYMIKFQSKSHLKEINAHHQILKHIAEIRQGVVAGPDRLRNRHLSMFSDILPNLQPNKGIFILSNDELKDFQLNHREKEVLMPFCYVRDLDQDVYKKSGKFQPQHQIIFLNGIDFEEPIYPNLYRYLSRYKIIMEQRRETVAGKRKWHELHWPRTRNLYTHPRILVIRRTFKPRFLYTEVPFVTDLSTNIIIPTDNSNIKSVYSYLISPEVTEWITFYAKKKGKMLQIDKSVLERIPIPDEFS
jgi:adenine-specific DNA-methyltransferase